MLDKEIYFEWLPNFENDSHCGYINTALQQPMKQQALDGSLHCPDQSCGLDDCSPAAAGPNWLHHMKIYLHMMKS